jgi:Fic-DOC domain mobile mystery protein B
MLSEAPGNTPLSPDEVEGLIPAHIATQGELNEAEEANITGAFRWALRVVRGRDVLSDDFAYELHRRMYGAVWAWAGRVRGTEKNIGIDPRQIRAALRELMEDARFWDAQGTYGAREIAVRLHHRLVKIHVFANGNGRHARMMADLYLLRRGEPVISWGPDQLRSAATAELRGAYIRALRAADAMDYGPLLEYCGMQPIGNEDTPD